MKQKTKTILLLAAVVTAGVLLTSSCSRAYDEAQDGNADYFLRSQTFAVDVNGQVLYFIPESEGSSNVLVTWNRINCSSLVDWVKTAGNRYAGNIEVPSTVTHNGSTYQVVGADDNAFYMCNAITSLVLPEGMTRWGEHTYFFSPFRTVMNKVTNIYLPTSLTELKTIPNYYFMNNTALVTCHIPPVEEIGDSAFYNCTKLTSLNLPATAAITDGFFIPSTVKRIGKGAFAGCNRRNHLVVESGNTVYTSTDGSGNELDAIIERSTGKLVLACKNTAVLTGLTEYGDYAFAGVYTTKNTTLEIPAEITTIGTATFLGCSGLRYFSVAAGNTVYDSRNNCAAVIETATNTLIAGCNYTVIPADVPVIGPLAFAGMTMSAMDITEGVTTIGEKAFVSCASMKSLTLPSTVKTIGADAFYGASKLTSVTIQATTPPVIANSTAFSNAAKCTLSVPAGCKEAYEKAPFWSSFMSIVEPDK